MISVHTTSQTIIVTLTGEFDISGAPALRRALDLAVSGEWRVAVIDCAGIGFVDLAGARPLVEAMDQARVTLTKVYLLHPSARVTPVLDFLGLRDAVVELESLPAGAEIDLFDTPGVADLFPDRSGR